MLYKDYSAHEIYSNSKRIHVTSQANIGFLAKFNFLTLVSACFAVPIPVHTNVCVTQPTITWGCIIRIFLYILRNTAAQSNPYLIKRNLALEQIMKAQRGSGGIFFL